ncbi:MAG: hypothetical protein RIM99_04065 [Cyclobacteriaceae bacterium]
MNPSRLLYIFSVIALLSVLLWLLGNYYGLGLTHDSFYYLDLASRSNPLELAPQKLYSFLLSFFGSKKIAAAAIINGVCLVGTLAIWGRLFLNSSLHPWIKILSFAALAMGVPMISVSSFLWTEILYICMTSITFSAYVEWRNSRNYRWIILLVISLFLALWARKVGAIFGAVTVYVILSDFIKLNRQRRQASLLFVFLLFGYWIVLYSGETPEVQYIFKNLEFNTKAVINWILPVTFPQILRYSIFVIVLTGLVFIKPVSHHANRLFRFYFLIYFIIRLPVDREFPEEADRYFSILFAPFVFFISHFVQSLYEQNDSRRKLVLGILTAFVVFSLMRTVKNTWMWNRNRLENQKLEITS